MTSQGEETRVAPHPVLSRYYEDEAQRQQYLRSAFQETAAHYDSINTWMSFGSDRWYRRQALVRSGLQAGMRMADVGCGTGLVSEMARDIVGPTGHVFSIDPSLGMISEAVAGGRTAAPVVAKAEALPIADEAVDFLCMGFALRHVADLEVTFREYLRLLKPGGTLLLMELTPPRKGFVRFCLKTHMRYVVPVLTRVFTGSKAATLLYEYCWDTFDMCVPPEKVVSTLGTAGFEDAARHVVIRVFSEYTARKPA